MMYYLYLQFDGQRIGRVQLDAELACERYAQYLSEAKLRMLSGITKLWVVDPTQSDLAILGHPPDGWHMLAVYQNDPRLD